MKLQDALDAISPDDRQTHVYSQPYQTADGVTIIAVCKVRGKVHAAGDGPGDVAVRAKPVGLFVIRGAKVKWEPAVDATPIALIGMLTGLVSATLATVAMIRRPPWPDLRGTVG